MNIGDRVRLLHGNEEGVITKISAGGRVEVEIEDGFRIPAMKNEVVVISAVEGQHFGGVTKPQEPTITSSKKITDKEGLFLSYLPINDKDHSLHLSNVSKRDYFTLVTELYGSNGQTLLAEKLGANSTRKLTEKSISNFEEWPTLLIQFFPIHPRVEKMEPSFERKIKFKASSFFKSKGKAPLLEKNGYVFQLSDQSKEIDVAALNKDLNPNKDSSTVQFQRPAKEIDLHIEKLSKEHEFLSNSEMIRLQMEAFEKALNSAIATGMDEISFIHGIGNGVLRKEIHKHLSQLDNIKYFQDTQKSRFGYGATLVRIS